MKSHRTVQVLGYSLVALLLCFESVCVVAANGASQAPATEEQAQRSLVEATGSFDGYSKQSNCVWVSDTVFQIVGSLKVVGTSTKVGLLSDIKEGETVTILYEKNGANQIPTAVEIRRK